MADPHYNYSNPNFSGRLHPDPLAYPEKQGVPSSYPNQQEPYYRQPSFQQGFSDPKNSQRPEVTPAYSQPSSQSQSSRPSSQAFTSQSFSSQPSSSFYPSQSSSQTSRSGSSIPSSHPDYEPFQARSQEFSQQGNPSSDPYSRPGGYTQQGHFQQGFSQQEYSQPRYSQRFPPQGYSQRDEFSPSYGAPFSQGTQSSKSSSSSRDSGVSSEFSRPDVEMSWEDLPQGNPPRNFSQFQSNRSEWMRQSSPEQEPEVLQGALIDNAKQHVILFCQRIGIPPDIRFEVEGPDHMRIYTAMVTVAVPRGPTISKRTSHKSKKEAEKISFDKVLQELSGMGLLSTAPSKTSTEDPNAQVVARKKEVREFCEKHFNHIPEATFRAVGPDHAPTFEALLTIPGGISGTGEAKTKKDAEKIAYAIVYEKLKSLKSSSTSAFAPSAYAPSAYAPSAYPPSAYPPSAYPPSAYAPSAYAPSASSASSASSRSTDYDSAYETSSTHSSSSRSSRSSASSSSSSSSSSSFPMGYYPENLNQNRSHSARGGQTSDPIPFSQGLSTAQIYATDRQSSNSDYVTSPIPITPEGTERSRKFIFFYCDHLNLGQPDIQETKTPPGVPNEHYIIMKSPVQAMSRGGSKAEARGHCFNFVAEKLRHKHPDIVEMFENVLMKNPHGLENLVGIALSPSQRQSMREIHAELVRADYGRTRDSSSFVPRVPPIFTPESSERLRAKSELLYQEHISRLNMPSMLRSEVAKLPIAQFRSKILQAIDQNQVVVVCAETGSGKTTQTPQFIFDNFIEQRKGAECNIIVTQPRRISAMTVALRVAEERGGQLGQTVGYNIRFESVMPRPNGCIVFCTTGILLRMLQSNPELDRVSHLILDEVHERDINNDFLMILIKDLLRRRPNLKVVLMSATINQQLFSDYFDGCPIVEIPGKMFHVETLYLDDISRLLHENRIVVRELINPFRREPEEDDQDEEASNDPMSLSNIPFALIESILVYIAARCSGGSVLIFLPGWEQIRELADLIRRDRFGMGFSNQQRFEIHCLHSSISSLHQHEVFRPVPFGVRKIILATNIAETSITLPDVVYVIDTVRQKEMNFIASRRMSSLDITWVSRANARQRMGRAGRVRPGVYFCLLTKERFHLLPEHQVPEMYRLDLQEICLSVKALGFPSIREFLNKALQPPDWKNVDAAVDRLKQLQALDYMENLTPLGRLLALLPVDPGLGKMLFSSIILDCLDPILTIIAASTTKDPFINTPERKAMSREKRIQLSRGTNSDHLAIVYAYNEWRKASSTPYVNSFCDLNCLSQPNLQNIRRIKEQLFKILVETSFIPDKPSNQMEPYGKETFNPAVVKALLCSGFYPNYAERAKKRMYRTKEDKTTFVHPSSVNYKGGSSESEGLSPFFVFQEKFRTARIFLTNTTQVSPFGILLFGGIPDSSSGGARTLVVDDWLIFSCAEEDAALIAEMRKHFDNYLRRCYANPQLVVQASSQQEKRKLEEKLVYAILDICASR